MIMKIIIVANFKMLTCDCGVHQLVLDRSAVLQRNGSTHPEFFLGVTEYAKDIDDNDGYEEDSYPNAHL
jgi:hypothetical protein